MSDRSCWCCGWSSPSLSDFYFVPAKDGDDHSMAQGAGGYSVQCGNACDCANRQIASVRNG